MQECENKNSRNKCQAMADWETKSDSSTSKLAGFLDVVLLLSATFYLKNYFKTAENFKFYY